MPAETSACPLSQGKQRLLGMLFASQITLSFVQKSISEGKNWEYLPFLFEI